MSGPLAPPNTSSDSTRSRGLRRADVVALAVIGVVLLLDLAMLYVGIDDQDEGYFAEQAVRVTRGQLPYRDFDSLYTPGLLYLHAGLFAALGEPHVLAIRILAIVGRAWLAFALYALARPLCPPIWAALPALYILIGLDRAPVHWEPHPGWLSMVGTVAAVWVVAALPRLPSGSRMTALGLVGAITGLVFLFKQNAGVFLGMSAASYVLLQGLDVPSKPVTRSLRTVQVLGLVGVLAMLGWLLRWHPQAGPLVLPYLFAPVAAIGLLMAFSAPVSNRGERPPARLTLLLPLVGGFMVVTLPWLVALVIALRGQVHYLLGFIGAVDPTPLALPPELPKDFGWTAVLGLSLAAVAGVHARGRARWGMLMLGCLLAVATVPLTQERHEPLQAATALAPGRAGLGLQAFLPIAALWAGLWLVRLYPSSERDWRLRWYVAAGAVTFLTQYPRMDNFHLVWSACIPLIVGAVALSRLHGYLSRRWTLTSGRRSALTAALLIVPVLSALPTVYWRGEAFVKRDRETRRPGLVPLVRLVDVPVVHGLVAPAVDRDRLLALRAYLQATTDLGEPILVYPTAPLLYLVAERPNPTRYSHLYPGAASPADLARLVATLEDVPVRTVVLADQGLLLWPSPGQNAELEEYISARFEEAARFGGYRVFSRRES